MVGEDTSQPPPPPITSTEAPQMVPPVKLPILKRVQMTKVEVGNEIKVPPVTAQQILARTRERKAKSTMLMAILDERLDRFHGIKDVKTLWAAIRTRFGVHAFYERKQFYKKTKRKLKFNKKEPVGFDKTKVECFNYHRRGHFARDCRTTSNLGNRSRDAGKVGYIGRDNGKRPAKKEDEKALVVQDGLGTYDWSYQIEEEATEFALMAFTLNPSSFSSLNSERKKLRKANPKIVGYKYGLESIEGQLRVHQQNKVIYEKKIRVLEYDVKDKSNLLKYTQKQLDKALKEKEELKVKLKRFESSLKNLTKLLDSQISAKVKTGLGYDSQFNEKEVLNVKEKEVTETVFDNRSSDEENSLANDRFKKGEGYHSVPPLLNGNYMPPKFYLSFARLDDSIYKFKISETLTSLNKNEKDAPETSIACVENPKEDRSSAPLIQDWDSDSDSESVIRPEHIPAKIDFVKTVFTRSGRIPVSAIKPTVAVSSSAAKPVNTAGPKQSVYFSKSRSTFHKSHSPIRRSFYNATAHSRRNSTERVNTAGLKAVSAVNGNRVTAVKTSDTVLSHLLILKIKQKRRKRTRSMNPMQQKASPGRSPNEAVQVL
nr:hypothetical protein [Tanacetum cinerariifolium]